MAASEFLGLWTYVYFGYNGQNAHALLGNSDKQTFVFENIKHYVPTYWAFLLGKDGIHGDWSGKFLKFGVKFGPGAFVDITRSRDLDENLPNFLNIIKLN